MIIINKKTQKTNPKKMPLAILPSGLFLFFISIFLNIYFTLMYFFIALINTMRTSKEC